jgi:hypothetical protein
MTPMGQHSATAAPRRDHLWVLVIIAACALLEVWASWIAIGSMSGFPRLGGSHGLPTDWTLAVTTEAYWGYALYSWLAAAPGPRSRAFAMWSAIAVFLLSLTGQGAAHLVKPGTAPPAALVVFVTALPVLVLALIAILVHLRQADREAAEAEAHSAAEAERLAAIERAEADERTALRAEVETLRASREADLTALRAEFAAGIEERDRVLADMETALSAARSEAEAATRKAEVLARKLAGPAGRSAAGTGRRGTASRTGAANTPRTAPDDDLELEAKALKLLATDLDMSGAELARRLGVSEGYGRKLRRRLSGDRPTDTEADRAGTASGDRTEDRA